MEAYQNLIPDTAGETLFALRQLVAQTGSYQIQGSFLNSTVSTTTFQVIPFQPASTDVRVNVLWFASLLFSLITASFGILVKQWLREYLAVENPSPQARLRLRHLRYPQLKAWKVFEIAAVLPLLLQLSLGLFFVGMCYFTTEVDSRVTHTVLPLVAGWAFCFLMATALPIFFPRCPYRTTLLRAPLRWVHDRVEASTSIFDGHNPSSFWSVVWEKIVFLTWDVTPSPFRSMMMHPRAVLSAFLPLLPFVWLLLWIGKQAYALWRSIRQSWIDLFVSLKEHRTLPLAPWRRSAVGTARSILTIFRIMHRALAAGNEQRVVLKQKKDLEILAAVDVIQSNDELLYTAISEAVSQLLLPDFHPADILSFAEELALSRLGTFPPVTPLFHIATLKGEVQFTIHVIISRYWSALPANVKFDREYEDPSRNIYSTLVSTAMLGATGRRIPSACLYVISRYSPEHIDAVCAALFNLRYSLPSWICDTSMAQSCAYFGLGPVRCELFLGVSPWLDRHPSCAMVITAISQLRPLCSVL